MSLLQSLRIINKKTLSTDLQASSLFLFQVEIVKRSRSIIDSYFNMHGCLNAAIFISTPYRYPRKSSKNMHESYITRTSILIAPLEN
jgi:hypothetical protein